MKENNKIQLSILRDRLQSIMNYDDPDYAFDVLLYGFGKKHKYDTWYNFVVKKGYMRVEDVSLFANYCGYPIHIG